MIFLYNKNNSHNKDTTLFWKKKTMFTQAHTIWYLIEVYLKSLFSSIAKCELFVDITISSIGGGKGEGRAEKSMFSEYE